MAYDKPYEAPAGSFNLFKNDKDGVETRPDYRGNGKDLDGNDIEVSAWLKESKDGKKYMSCKISPPFKKTEKKEYAKDTKGFEQDVPF